MVDHAFLEWLIADLTENLKTEPEGKQRDEWLIAVKRAREMLNEVDHSH